MPTTDPAAPRSWTFLDAPTMEQMLARSLSVEARFSSGFPEPGEQAVRTVIKGFSELLAHRRPPFAPHQQPRAHLMDHWWCAGLVEAQGGTVVALCIPQRDDESLDDTLIRTLQHEGHVLEAWLGIGTLGTDGTLQKPLQTIGCSLLLQWPKNPRDPQHLAMLDLAVQTVNGGLHVALSALERSQLLDGMDLTTPEGPRGPRSRL